MTNVITLAERYPARRQDTRPLLDMNALATLRASLTVLNSSLQRELVFLNEAIAAFEGIADEQ